MINRGEQQRQGSGVASVRLVTKGAKRTAQTASRRATGRQASWPVREGESLSQSTLERLRVRSGPRTSSAVADLLSRERMRIAADVHDLVMQDLALALATARMLAYDDPEQAARASAVVTAGERALAGARRMVDDLVKHDPKPIVDAVEASVHAAAGFVPVSFCADGVPAGRQPEQPTLDAVVHVAREAVTNAVKHAAPSAVDVVLECGERWRLLVRDDGCGFDSQGAYKGFGLTSMTAQTRALGGTLRVTSVGGTGTTVEAILP